MNALDVLRSAFVALYGHGKRTLFSLLGVAIGVAAVVVLTGLGEGARQFLRGQFEVIGSDVLGIVPGKVETTGGIPGVGGVPHDLTLADARALQRGVPGVLRVSPILFGNGEVGFGDRARRVMILGATAENLALRRLEMRSGRFLPDGDWERGSREIVLGQGLARALFPAGNPLGERVRVGGWRMRVIGVLASQGVHFGIDMDETAFVPVATAQAMFDERSLARIAVQLRPGADLDAVQARCVALLRERHGEEDFTVTTPDAILGSLESILGALTLALIGIASISLAVAGIGIMNVMLVSVSERTEEIGLSKAIGALPRQVLTLFLTEAVALSIAGALLGLAVGYGVLHGAELAFPSFPFRPPWWAGAAAVALAVVVGGTFGLWPALRAVRLDPVVALSGRKR